MTLLLACTRAPAGAEPGDAQQAMRNDPSCPATLPPADDVPGTPADRERLDYWLAQDKKALDSVLMPEPAISALASALRFGDDGTPRSVALGFPLPEPEVKKLLDAHLAFWRERFQSGEYGVDGADARALFEAQVSQRFSPASGLGVALEEAQLACVPIAQKVLKLKGDLRFDRNACSRVRAQEPVELLGTLGADWSFVRSRDALAFLPTSAKVKRGLSPAHAEALRAGRERELLVDLARDGVKLEKGTRLASDERGRVFIARMAEGASAPIELSQTEAAPAHRPLTRRAFLGEAFRYLHAPYGLGDERGGRDCSRYVSDVLRPFGLHVPRLSGEQSKAGQYALEIPADASEADRLSLLDEAVQRGVVLIHFPGHIMFYLGRDADGVPRAIHSFAEYMTPCAGGGETLHEVGGVRVSDLGLGKGSSRRSFLERMVRLTVFGEPPSAAAVGLAQFRRAAPMTATSVCEQGKDASLFLGKLHPEVGDPLRFIAVSARDMRPADIVITGPGGELQASSTHDLGLGPFARVGTTSPGTPGSYTARLLDGENVRACVRVDVRSAPPKRAAPELRSGEAPAWVDHNAWAPRYEQLYAAFVEQLFSYPLEEQRSFKALHEVLRDPERNLLYDHGGAGEDTRLSLSPDCADLPYFLRAYFAWRMSLPFGYRKCSRGRAGSPPKCGELLDNRAPVAGTDAVSAFERYARTHVANGVHSASGRTLPEDPETDLYPLPLSRSALPPGTVFVDPYGHLIVVAKWLPEAAAGSGVLLGADAQPDHTVGRRRFWRGNFLFTPDLKDVGAGFKAFRPLERDRGASTLAALDDAQIAKQAPARAPSHAQYDGDADAFYERMDTLIHPRPLNAAQRMNELVNALEEQVVRRVEAIDVGEAYMRKSAGVMAMPEPAAIFETTGAWEDFATPSRDMRLLIAIDAVMGLPDAVRKQPARYSADPAAVDALSAQLDAALAARKLAYTRTDGSRLELTLAEVVKRAPAIELGYNPNDCVERRWGAADGSAELSSCKRRAPEAQLAVMRKVRPWFQARTRPARM